LRLGRGTPNISRTLSGVRCARAFAAETGSTPARFVEQTRVAAAARLLGRTRWTQDKIASRSGFRSVDALPRAFARQYGVTPRAYREAESASSQGMQST
jgi:AraC-like DNA-binding protein